MKKKTQKKKRKKLGTKLITGLKSDKIKQT